MTPTELNSTVQSILATTRDNTEAPFEGMYVLSAASYAFWKQYGTSTDFPKWLEDLNKTLKDLHLLNTMKGSA